MEMAFPEMMSSTKEELCHGKSIGKKGTVHQPLVQTPM